MIETGCSVFRKNKFDFKCRKMAEQYLQNYNGASELHICLTFYI